MLADILSGEYSTEEYETFNAWMSADSSNAREFEAMKSYWNASVSDRFEIDTNKELNKLMKRVNSSHQRRHVYIMRRVWAGVAVAASLLLGVFAGWGVASSYNKETSKEYTCMTGESISSFVLPDGSKVHLNKNSRLDYNDSFGKKTRTVHLEGEAFFDVKRMEDCKFTVNLDGADITVRGTTFNAFNHVNSGIKGAALVTGSIDFQSDSQYLKLSPSRQVVYDAETKEMSVSSFDPTILTAWKDNLFRYKSLTVYDLVDALMQKYDMDIVVVDGNYGNDKYSGALDIALPNDNIIDIVAMQIGATWTEKSGVYYISKQ